MSAALGWEPRLASFCHLKWHLPRDRSVVPAQQGGRRCRGLAERPLSPQHLSNSEVSWPRLWGRATRMPLTTKALLICPTPPASTSKVHPLASQGFRGFSPVARVRGGPGIRNRPPPHRGTPPPFSRCLAPSQAASLNFPLLHQQPRLLVPSRHPRRVCDGVMGTEPS